MASIVFAIIPLFIFLLIGFGVITLLQKANTNITVHKLYLFFVSTISIIAFLVLLQGILQSEISYALIDKDTYISHGKVDGPYYGCEKIDTDCAEYNQKRTLDSREFSRKTSIAAFTSWGLLWFLAYFSHFPVLVRKEIADEKIENNA